MKKIFAIFSFTLLYVFTNLAAGDPLTGVNYHIITKKQKKPIDLQLSMVEFTGSNQAIVSNLNSAVKKLWNNDLGCDLTGVDQNTILAGGEYDRSLLVKKMTHKIVVLQDTYSASCPATAHPSSGTTYYFLEVPSGQTISLWDNLSDINKNKILSLISKNGMTVHKNENECREEYQLDNLKQSVINVSLSSDKISFIPAFSYAAQACAEPFNLSFTEAEEYFKGNEKILSILQSLQKANAH